MKQMVGGAMEALCNQGGSGRKPSWGPRFKSLFLKHVLPVKRLDDIYSEFDSLPRDIGVADRILEALNVTYRISADDQAKTPPQGPLVVVANHPFGAIEGMILASILLKARNDAKIMANFLLRFLGISELDDLLVFVDPFARAGSVAQNLRPLREAVEWVKGGRALGIFPAGEVSHMHLSSFSVMDRQWSPTVAKIVRKTEATVYRYILQATIVRFFADLVFCIL